MRLQNREWSALRRSKPTPNSHRWVKPLLVSSRRMPTSSSRITMLDMAFREVSPPNLSHRISILHKTKCSTSSRTQIVELQVNHSGLQTVSSTLLMSNVTTFMTTFLRWRSWITMRKKRMRTKTICFSTKLFRLTSRSLATRNSNLRKF